MDFTNLLGTPKSLSPLKNPFSKECVESVFIHSSRSIFSSDFRHSGKVSFKNGNTKGEQEFSGESFEVVLNKMQEFVKTLE